jgi:hypothetical protein
MSALTELRDWLIGQGFKLAANGHKSRDNTCVWYAYRRSTIPARTCECNEKSTMQLVVTPYSHIGQPGWTSVEVDVTGEAGGVWYKLQAYSLKPDELREKLPAIEAALMAAWNAIPTEKQAQGELL